MGEKKDYLNYLRAFAAVFVVLHHAIVYSGLDESNVVMQALLNIVSNVHVPLFFCVAGYLCHTQNVFRFYLKKWKQILIPFLLFTVLKLIYTNLVSDAFAHASLLSAQIADAFLHGSLYWFAYSILLLFLVSPLLWQLKKWNLLLFVGLIVANLILEREHIVLSTVFQLKKTVAHACFFVGGFVLQHYTSFFLDLHRRKMLLCCVCLMAVAGILYLNLAVLSGRPYLLWVIYAFSLMYLLFCLSSALPGGIRWLNFLGTNSLQIMFFDSFYKVLLFMFLPEDTVFSVFLSVLLNISMTCMSILIIRKLPYIRVLFGIQPEKNV